MYNVAIHIKVINYHIHFTHLYILTDILQKIFHYNVLLFI
nr:MAG TPA: hypothetical protein [Bacteriophage sp.]